MGGRFFFNDDIFILNINHAFLFLMASIYIIQTGGHFFYDAYIVIPNKNYIMIYIMINYIIILTGGRHQLGRDRGQLAHH